MMFADMMTLREEQQARSGLQAGALPLSLPVRRDYAGAVRAARSVVGATLRTD